MSFIGTRTARALVLATTAAGILAACADAPEPTSPVLRPQTANASDVAPQAACYGVTPIDITGRITTNTTLTNTNTYRLRGVVNVIAPATLTIQPGTCILGAVDTTTALVVNKGAKIQAVGTAAQPITFTSANSPGTRAAGDWGGILIIGNSTCNQPTQADCVVEGLPSTTKTYGSVSAPNYNDNSGSLQYVLIQFTGKVISAGNELNGLGLFGVGAGTVIENVQVHRTLDDGVELFGGTVNLKRILVTGAEDDSFDYSFGWGGQEPSGVFAGGGKAQFLVAQQLTTAGDKGIEADNEETSPYTNLPYTTPRIYNVTLVGRPAPASGNVGMHLRRGAAGRIFNAIVVQFNTAGLDVDDPETYAHCGQPSAVPPRLLLSNSIIFNTPALYDPDVDGQPGDPTAEATCTALIRNAAPMLVSPFNQAAPDFRPKPGSIARTGAASPPNDGFFEPVTYVGGVAPDVPQFFAGWAVFPVN